MKFSSLCGAIGALVGLSSATILQNGQVRMTSFPNTVIDPSAYKFKSYQPDAHELSYKGRWDSKHVSWWSTPGLKFAFTGQQVAITFGPQSVDTTLIGYRIDGQDWLFTNVTSNATQLLVSPSTSGVSPTTPSTPSTFEMRVTNWAYGVQISKVHVSEGEKILKIPDFGRRIEVIGDSLSSGYGATYEGLSSYAYGLAAGLGDTEYSIISYPGICLYDQPCFGNPRGLVYQWFQTSDSGGRAFKAYGTKPEPWDFSKHPAADIVVINIGTNDANPANNAPAAGYVAQYKLLIEGIHAVWPKAQIILVSIWQGWRTIGNTYQQSPAWVSEIYSIYEYFNSPEYLQNPILYDSVKNKTYHGRKPSAPFVHYFNSTGIMQHNDNSPVYHPTDAGHIKVASHLMQYIKLKFGWDLYATGPEVFHETTYWNNLVDY